MKTVSGGAEGDWAETRLAIVSTVRTARINFIHGLRIVLTASTEFFSIPDRVGCSQTTHAMCGPRRHHRRRRWWWPLCPATRECWRRWRPDAERTGCLDGRPPHAEPVGCE